MAEAERAEQKGRLARARDKAVGAVQKGWKDLRIGDGHGGGMARLGLRELRNAASWGNESVEDSEIGIYGTLTQGEIASARGDLGLDAEQEKRRGTKPQGEKASARDVLGPAVAQDRPGEKQNMENESVLGYSLEPEAQAMAQGMEQPQVEQAPPMEAESVLGYSLEQEASAGQEMGMEQAMEQSRGMGR